MEFPKWRKSVASLLSAAERFWSRSGLVIVGAAVASSATLVANEVPKPASTEVAQSVQAKVTRYSGKFLLAPSAMGGPVGVLAQHSSHTSHTSHASHASHSSGGMF